MIARIRLAPRALLLALALSCPPALPAQAADPGTLTLDRIFSREFATERFGPARWLADGRAYTTLEPAAGGGGDVVRYEAGSGARIVLVPAARLVPAGASAPLEIEDYHWSPDARRLLVFTNTERVWRANTRGDYWVLELGSGALRKLGGEAAPSTLMFAEFSPDGTRVAYVRENDLYVEEVATGSITRLTNDGSRTTINGTFDWVHEEEFGLRDGFRWSPDGRRIAYWQLDASGVRDFYLVNNTDSLYSRIVPVQYPKAGGTNSAVRVGVVDAAGGPTRWLELPGEPRNRYVARMDWAGGSDEVVLQHLNRQQNHMRVMLGDARTGAVRTVLEERDSAWIDVVDDLRWLQGGRRFTWVSERDGWRRVYLASRDGRQAAPVTPAGVDVIGVEAVDERGGWLYYAASPDNATQRYLFRARLDGRGRAERLTPAPQAGSHAYQVAPGGGWAIHTFSRFGAPPETDLVRLPDHRVQRVLAGNAELDARVAALRRTPGEFVRVDVGGGVQLDGWVIKPADFDPARKYPVLFHVYGEPASQTVLDAWGGRDYLWHQMLAQQGYVVVSFDNRGTPAPRGRAWRKSIHGRLGVLNTADQAAAARAVRSWPFVDTARVAIWGWSGGGETSLNAIFRYPELFGTAMAVAPLTDFHYYDTIYQERYMGLPQDAVAAYREGSPLTWADRLRGNLLVVHGTGDDNVHYQNTEALVNALVAANRPFQMMAYPNRSHGIYEGRNTSRHLFELLTRYLRQHVPAGPATT
jgi:dipeptidyl-peptidase-4